MPDGHASGSASAVIELVTHGYQSWTCIGQSLLTADISHSVRAVRQIVAT
jgi:hypothetical protein